ncbi:hypothetical protein DKX38_024898 [Salix brachista]|uniref:Uncharacterized protein n=1 Tax=Salix brachista TaxID=2182728 RepID=A0A5N5JMW0_9ROSI|nr:hypothetical protein DKX38_024898 [Salix brachista]
MISDELQAGVRAGEIDSKLANKIPKIRLTIKFSTRNFSLSMSVSHELIEEISSPRFS